MEYKTVMKRANAEGWLSDLIAAHHTPCSQNVALALLAQLTEIPALTRMLWRNRRGHAAFRKDRYSISLPTDPGIGFARLRVGLVLHEAAHVLDHMTTKKFSHGPTFCAVFRELILKDWSRIVMPTRSFYEIYDRHRGPFSILVTRDSTKAKKVTVATDRIDGPFNASEAHDRAVGLVNDPGGNVQHAFIYSDTEQQYIGATYKRGEEYDDYAREQSAYQGGLELPDQRVKAALLPSEPEPLRPMDDPKQPVVPAETIPAHRPVRSVPPKEPTEPRAKRTPPAPRAQTRLELGAGEWPKSQGAQTILDYFTEPGVKATSKQICEALGPRLTELGVQFPASLVSRLKQSGLLKEAVDE